MTTPGGPRLTGLKPNAPEFKPKNVTLHDPSLSSGDLTSPSVTPNKPYPATPPTHSPTSEPASPATVIENPIGDLKELCDFVRTPYSKSFEEEGHAHSKKYKCILIFCGRRFESEWVTSQKEAEKTAALRLLHTLPVRRVDDSFVCIFIENRVVELFVDSSFLQVQQRGSSHDMHFQAVVRAPDINGNMRISVVFIH